MKPPANCMTGWRRSARSMVNGVLNQRACAGATGARRRRRMRAKISKDEAVIDWNEDAVEVHRKIRAFNPFPGASTMLAGERIKLWRAQLRRCRRRARSRVCGAGRTIDRRLRQRRAVDHRVAARRRQAHGRRGVSCGTSTRGGHAFRRCCYLMRDAQLLAAGVVERVLAGRTAGSGTRRAVARQTFRRQRTSALWCRTCATACCGICGALDALLAPLLAKPLRDERLRHLLRVALYQLEHTRAAPHAVVDHAVAACAALRAAPAKGLVNAVLRNFLRRRAEMQAAAHRSDTGRYSYPQWWIDKIRAQYPKRLCRPFWMRAIVMRR